MAHSRFIPNIAMILLIMVLSLWIAEPAFAQETEITRTVEGPIYADSEFDVVLTVSDLQIGGIVETLPNGFTCVGTSLPDERVEISDQHVVFSIIGDTEITYQVKAPDNGGGTITGVWDDALNETNGTIAGTPIAVYSTSGGDGGGSVSSSSSTTTTSSGTSSFEILKGETKTLEFPECDICELAVSVREGNLSGMMNITQTSAPPDVPAAPGRAYRYFSIEGTNTSGANVSVEIHFSVNRTWIENQAIDPSTIVMYHYSGGNWTALNTTQSGEDTDSLSFTAVSPGLSVFAISGESTATIASTTTEPTESVPESTQAEVIPANTVKAPVETTTQKSPVSPGIALAGLCGAALVAAYMKKERK